MTEEILEESLKLLQFRPSENVEDCCIWASNINATYAAKAGYKWLLEPNIVSQSTSTAIPGNFTVRKDKIPELQEG